MRLVLDASAAVRVVMRAEGADGLLESVATATVVTAPSLYASEVAVAIRNAELFARVESQNARLVAHPACLTYT